MILQIVNPNPIIYKPTINKTMQSIKNYVEIEVHNKIIQSLRDRQLQYKTKIIELQKQQEYEINRANQFQQKFKQALLQTGVGNQQDLLQKLSQRQNQNNQLRMEVFRLKKSIDSLADNNPSSKGSISNAQLNQLMNQNQQMAKTIEQLKNAAISAIISKDDQIEQLNEKLTKAQYLSMLYQNLLQREESLEKQIDKLRLQSQEQQKSLSQKLSKQRQKYLEKLEEFQSNLQHEESSKQQLLEKAELLQNNLENKQQVIELYQNKLNEFQATFRHERQIFQQQKEKLFIEIDNLKDKQSIFQKQASNFQKIISENKFKEKQFKIMNERLREENGQLQRKLTIKKRKNNPKLKSSDIYSSFEGISQKSSFYSSFYKPTQQLKPTNLGQIEELQENDVLDSFIDLQERPQQKIEQIKPNLTKKKQKVMQIEISPDLQIKNTQTLQIYSLTQQKVEQKPVYSELQVPNTDELTKNQPQNKSQTVTNMNQQNQIRSLQTQVSRCMQQIASFKERNESLKKKLQQCYTQMQRLSKQIKLKTQQIQKQRQSLAQLRSQNKKSQSEKELMVEYQNYKQHVFKLENALLIEKLQNAEKEEFMKERNEREKKSHDQKIARLNEEIKNLSPKKKKGFFR